MKTDLTIPISILCAFLAASCVQAQGEEWTSVYSNGATDTSGQTMVGIQMMFLAPHQGRLYAGNGVNGESNTVAYPQQAQVLLLDSVNGHWRVDKQFTSLVTVSSMSKAFPQVPNGGGSSACV